MPKETNINQDYVIKQRQSIGDRIRFVRTEIMDLTREELADQVGVTPLTVERIETGEFDFKLDLIIRFCIMLNLSIELI